jgi:molybdopterin converting factor small subunit
MVIRCFFEAKLNYVVQVPCYHQIGLGRMLVEFLGVPRRRAGVSEIEVQAGTLGELLGILSTRIPSFSELISVDRLHPALVANLNGERFISDPQTALRHDDSVLILSADAGG